MDKRQYIDIHVIQTVPPSCINRDDTNSPKTCVYGGVTRARVSSQSWKRAVRRSFTERVDEKNLSVRTKKIVELVASKIREIDERVSEKDALSKAQDVLMTAGVQISKPNKKSSDIPEAQALFFMSTKQAENMARLALEGGYNKDKAQKALNANHGIDIALFGRMVANDATLNADASAQVAHAISTHRVENEYDFYTAVDEMSSKKDTGAGMMDTVEFNSSTMYRYATVAVHDLKRQLSDDDAVTSMAVQEFVRAFVLSMPTGKMNTFANRTVPDYVLIKIRDDQPVNYVGAFERPVMPARESGGYVEGSVKALMDYDSAISSMVPPAVMTLAVGKRDLAGVETVDLQTAIEDIGKFIAEER